VILSKKEKFSGFFRDQQLQRRVHQLECLFEAENEAINKSLAEHTRAAAVTQHELSTSQDRQKLLEGEQQNLQYGFDEFVNGNRQAHAKIKDDFKFDIWLLSQNFKGEINVLKEDITLEVKKIEDRVAALENRSQPKQMTSTPQQCDPFEGREFSPDIKALIQKAHDIKENPNLGTKTFDLLTDEQKDLVPDTWDVLGGIYSLNETIGHATLTDIRGRVQRFKPSDVRDVLKKLTRSGFVSQRQLTAQEWAGHRSNPPLTQNLTPVARQIFFPQSNDNTGMMHVAMELEFFLQILQRPRPLLYVSIRQQPGVTKFDGAIFGRASSDSFKWFGCDAVNVETDEEVRAHPEQVLMNMITPFFYDIERLKMVCSKESEATLTDLKSQLPSWLSGYIDIVVVSISTDEGRK
jgi:hypothetical protein